MSTFTLIIDDKDGRREFRARPEQATTTEPMKLGTATLIISDKNGQREIKSKEQE